MRARGVATLHVADGQRQEHGGLCYARWLCGASRGRDPAGWCGGGPLAMALGLALAVPAAWVEFSGRYDAWWVDGVGARRRRDRTRAVLDGAHRSRVRTGLSSG